MYSLPNAGYLLDQLLNSSLDAIYFKDLQSRVIMINQACATKHGWKTPAEGIGKSDFDVFAGEHAAKAFADEQRIIATGEPLMGIEEKELWPDGRITWCSTTKMPLRDDTGAIFGIFGITRDITERKEAELRAKRYAEIINAIKEELEEDVRVAGELQKNFFLSGYPLAPDPTDPLNACIDFYHHFSLSRQVGGDYCSIRRLSANQVAIFLCDIGGVGTRAALGAALIRGVMQEIEDLGGDPSAYLGRMNELLYPLLHPDHLLMDVTTCYIVLDLSTGQVRLASAGHPQPLHFRPGQPLKWLFENLVLRGPALAVEPDTRYRTIQCRLVPDDTVVLFTDGLFTVKNAMGEPFSEKRLFGAAEGLVGESLETVFQGLEDEALAFSMEGRFTDDVCLVGLHLRKLMETA